VFQMFLRYVASVAYGCCKSRLKCCTCCKGYTHMLQVFVHVSSIFRRILQVCLSRCCICFTQMLQEFVRNVLSISNACCKCFIWMLHIFHVLVSNVSSISDVCCSKSFWCCKCFHV
jgi:hypothetical protein